MMRTVPRPPGEKMGCEMSEQHSMGDETSDDRDRNAGAVGRRADPEPQVANSVDDSGAGQPAADPLRDIDPTLYDELRAIASVALRGESPKTAPSTTSLVHEVWLRLARNDRSPTNDRQHLLALASLVARRALVDAARARAALKRTADATSGGQSTGSSGPGDPPTPTTRAPKAPVTLPDDFAGGSADPAEILSVDELLTRLAAIHPRQAKALELRIFGGVPPERIAEALDISPTQAKRDVAFARAWLVAQLTDGPQPHRGGRKDRPTP